MANVVAPASSSFRRADADEKRDAAKTRRRMPAAAIARTTAPYKRRSHLAAGAEDQDVGVEPAAAERCLRRTGSASRSSSSFSVDTRSSRPMQLPEFRTRNGEHLVVARLEWLLAVAHPDERPLQCEVRRLEPRRP